jgi:hypothetical protein
LRTKNIFFYFEKTLWSAASPTIASCNASAVKFYNATSSLVRFENKNIFSYFEKRSSLLQRWRCSCKFESRSIGLQEVVVVNVFMSKFNL